MKISATFSILFIYLHLQSNTCEANDTRNNSVRSTEGAEFMFVASISLKNYGHDPDIPVQICSGVLITRKHVLTSAHCIEEVNNLEDVRVKLGFIDYTFAAKYPIKAWTTYTLWAKDNDIDVDPFEHDISILKLTEPVKSPIIPALITNHTNDFFYGNRVKTVTWDAKWQYRSEMLLKVAELDVISYNECKKELNASPLMLKNHTVDKAYLCTKINLGAVLQDIDSGAPLLINENELIAINDPNYLRRNGIHAPTNLNFHVGLGYYRTFIKNVTETKSAKWWRWKRN